MRTFIGKETSITGEPGEGYNLFLVLTDNKNLFVSHHAARKDAEAAENALWDQVQAEISKAR